MDKVIINIKERKKHRSSIFIFDETYPQKLSTTTLSEKRFKNIIISLNQIGKSIYPTQLMSCLGFTSAIGLVLLIIGIVQRVKQVDEAVDGSLDLNSSNEKNIIYNIAVSSILIAFGCVLCCGALVSNIAACFLCNDRALEKLKDEIKTINRTFHNLNEMKIQLKEEIKIEPVSIHEYNTRFSNFKNDYYIDPLGNCFKYQKAYYLLIEFPLKSDDIVLDFGSINSDPQLQQKEVNQHTETKPLQNQSFQQNQPLQITPQLHQQNPYSYQQQLPYMNTQPMNLSFQMIPPTNQDTSLIFNKIKEMETQILNLQNQLNQFKNDQKKEEKEEHKDLIQTSDIKE